MIVEFFTILWKKWRNFYKKVIIDKNEETVYRFGLWIKPYLPNKKPFNEFSPIWLKLVYLDFVWWLEQPKSIIAFSVLTPILTILAIIYVFLLSILTVYWLFKFTYFLSLPPSPDLRVIKPTELNTLSFSKYWFLVVIYSYTILRAYLISYFIVFTVLAKLSSFKNFNYNNKPSIFFALVILSMLYLLTKIILTPYDVLINHSFYWSGKFRNFWENPSAYESKFVELEIKSLNIYLLIHNPLLTAIEEIYVVYVMPITGEIQFGPHYKP